MEFENQWNQEHIPGESIDFQTVISITQSAFMYQQNPQTHDNLH